MLNLSRKQLIIIIVLVIVILLIIAVNIFLYLNYQSRRTATQEQTKVAQDVKMVEGLINQGRIDELDIQQLKSEGVAEEAITIAEEAIREQKEKEASEAAQYGFRTIDSLTFEEKRIVNINNNAIAGYSKLNESSYQETLNTLLATSKKIVSDLASITDVQDIDTRFNAYYSLIILGGSSDDLKTQAIPVLKKGLQDPAVHISATAAVGLIGLGEKDGLSSIISRMDSKYNDVIMYAEPPARLPNYAYDVLRLYTDQDFETNQTKWQEWWENNQDNIQWDKEKDIFVTL